MRRVIGETVRIPIPFRSSIALLLSPLTLSAMAIIPHTLPWYATSTVDLPLDKVDWTVARVPFLNNGQNEREVHAKKGFNVCLFPRFGLESNPQRHLQHI